MVALFGQGFDSPRLHKSLLIKIPLVLREGFLIIQIYILTNLLLIPYQLSIIKQLYVLLFPHWY